MPQADASSFTRVAVVAPASRVDVALPSDIPVVDLLPGLLDMVGERSDDGGGSHDGWRLSTLDGAQLDPSRTLRALDVLDGQTLRMAPARDPLPEPVHDDVVEAIAAAVRDRTDARSIRDDGRAFAAAALLVTCALVLVLGGTGVLGAMVGAGVAAISLVVGRALALGRARRTGQALAVAAAAPAFAAGWLLPTGGDVPTHLLLASAAAAAVTLVTRFVLPGAAVALAAQSTALGFVALAALAAVLLGTTMTAPLVAVSALAIGAMSFLPWFGVRMARLPLPVLPSSGEDLRTSVPLPQDELSRRARAGADLAEGTLVGLTLVAAIGALAAASTGSRLGIAYAVVALAVLALRTRGVAGRTPRMALLGVPVVAAVLALAVAATRLAEVSALTLALALALATIALAVVAMAPQRTSGAPVAGRWVNLLEMAALVALLPLAVGAMDLYSYVRHL